MASYLVVEPPVAAAERPERAVLIREGFSFLAFLFPLFWFLWHRMWLESLAFLALAIALGGLAALQGFEIVVPLLSLLLALLIGLEAHALYAASLRRKGWREWGVVEGASRGEAELRYAAEVDEPSTVRPPAAPPAVPAVPQASPGGRARSPAFGLIDYPRKS